MKNQDSIEGLFKEKLEHFEADVSSHVWSGIKSGIGSGSAGASAGAKIAIGKIVGGISAIGVLTGGVWYFSQHEKEQVASSSEAQPKTELIADVIKAESPGIYSAEEFSLQEAEKKIVLSAEEISTSPTQKYEQKSDMPLGESVIEKMEEETDASFQQPPLRKLGKAPKGDGGISRVGSSYIQSKPEETGGDNTLASDDISSSVLPVTSNDAVPQEENTSQNEQKQDLISEVPNSFTPNGDGVNDYFIFADQKATSVVVEIFSQKTGELVCRWNQIGGKWDGKLPNGNDAPEGSYIYSIRATGIDGTIQAKQGLITLFR